MIDYFYCVCAWNIHCNHDTTRLCDKLPMHVYPYTSIKWGKCNNILLQEDRIKAQVHFVLYVRLSSKIIKRIVCNLYSIYWINAYIF